MNITIIHGQSHKETSYYIGRTLVEQIGTKNNITEFFLPQDLSEFCRGCCQCLKNGMQFCPHFGQLKIITKAINKADLLVFTTPVYCMRGSAAMKSLFEHHFTWWMNHRPNEAMFHKKAVIIAAGAGGGTKKAIADIKTNLDNWGISAIWTYSFVSGAMSLKEVKKKKLEKSEQDMTILASKVIKKNIKIRAGQKFHFICMRFMHRMNWGVPQDKVYWKGNGWLETARPWKRGH
ncbi:MAG: flavodoxin family protein [Lachnospiraceae bacterium]